MTTEQAKWPDLWRRWWLRWWFSNLEHENFY